MSDRIDDLIQASEPAAWERLATNGDRATGTCPRCRTTQWADVSEPWERLDGHLYEWVTVHPHLHARTQRSTCRPKGYSRRATDHNEQEQ